MNVKTEENLTRSVQTALISIENEFEMMNFHVVFNADHHVFLKCSKRFNDIMKSELQHYIAESLIKKSRKK